jgi:probable phosphoglycerate mutase
MIRILLVRHGESEWNATGRWQGQADPPLTELGYRQAKHAGAAIGAVDAVVASDLERARVTAEVISAQIGVGPVVLDPDLRERDAGEWQGLTRAQIHQQWPGYLPDDPVHGSSGGDRRAMRRPPSYEADEVLIERGLRALHRIADQFEQVGQGDVVAVTHGGVIHALEQHLGVTDWVRIPNLGARWVALDGGRITLGERLVLVDPDELTDQPPDQL